MITLLLPLLLIVVAARLTYFRGNPKKDPKLAFAVTLLGAIGVGLYLLSAAFPFYICAGKGNNCGGPGYGDVFMIPFLFSPIGFAAAFVVAFGTMRLLKPFVRLLMLVMTISISAVFYFEKSLFAAGFASIPILLPLILVLGADVIAMAFARPTARSNELPR